MRLLRYAGRWQLTVLIGVIILIVSCAGSPGQAGAAPEPVGSGGTVSTAGTISAAAPVEKPDQGRLLLHSWDGSVLILDAYDGTILASAPKILASGPARLMVGQSGEVGYVASQLDGQMVIADSGYILMPHGGHHDLVTNDASILGIHETGFVTERFFSNGKFAYVGNLKDGMAQRFDEQTIRSFRQVPAITALPYTVATSEEPALAADVVYGNNTYAADPAGMLLGGVAGEPAQVLPLLLDGRPAVPVLPLAGNFLLPHLAAAVRGVNGYALVLHEYASGRQHSVRLERQPLFLQYDPFGSYLLLLDESLELFSLDPRTLEVRLSVQLGGGLMADIPAVSVALCAGTSFVWLSVPGSGLVSKYRLSDFSLVDTFALPEGIEPSALALMRTVGEKH